MEDIGPIIHFCERYIAWFDTHVEAIVTSFLGHLKPTASGGFKKSRKSKSRKSRTRKSRKSRTRKSRTRKSRKSLKSRKSRIANLERKLDEKEKSLVLIDEWFLIDKVTNQI